MDKATARALLGIDDENPTKEQINEAYRNAAKLNHPDNYAGDEKLKEHAERQMRLINEARQVLLSESERESAGERRNRNENNRNAYTAYVQYWDYVRPEGAEDGGSREHERAANRTKSSSGASNPSSASRPDATEHPGTSSKTDIPQSPEKPAASPANGSSPDAKRENGCVLALIIVSIVIVMFALYSTAAPSHSEQSSTDFKEVSYSSSQYGFKASFPEKPDVENRKQKIPGLGKVSMTCFYGDRGPYFTYAFVVHSKKMASSIDMTNHNKDHEAARDFFFAAAPSPLVTLSGSELSPSFGWERGFPDAKAVCLATSKASGSSRGTSVYYFTECVATDTKVYFICGTRSTRSAAEKVIDSFALKDVVYKNTKAGFKAAFPTIPIVYNGSDKDKTDSFWSFYCMGDGPENTEMTVTAIRRIWSTPLKLS